MADADGLSLYHYDTCPFCARVRDASAQLGIDLPLRDILRDPARARELEEATGRRTVPCLRIEDASGAVRWMHESADIIAYLVDRFGSEAR